MNGPEPWAEPGGRAATGDELAARRLAAQLLAAQRLLAHLSAPPEVRIRLNLRFMAICTSLKMPGCRAAGGADRLERLMADAEQAANSGEEV
jgi:hypothetical protein